MARLRGRWHEFQGIPLMATYHPAYLLRNQSLTEKRKVWEDMLKVMERTNLPISEKQRGFFLVSSRCGFRLPPASYSPLDLTRNRIVIVISNIPKRVRVRLRVDQEGALREAPLRPLLQPA